MQMFEHVKVRMVKSSYANVRKQIFIRDKVRMAKVHTQNFYGIKIIKLNIRRSNVRTSKGSFEKKVVSNCSYAKVRAQIFVRDRFLLTKRTTYA